MKKLMVILITLIFSIFSYAEDKHPRVAELEDRYKKTVMEFLDARFPGLPFSATVSIDPLRRNFGNYQLKGEQLPFFALDDEAIQDEWDDPTATLYTLSNRVKKVSVIVQVPNNLKDDELAEIQTSLTNVLRLIPARDEIQILKREWTIFPYLKMYAALFAAALLIFFIGLFIISRLFAGKMATSLEALKSKTSNQGSNTQAPMPQAPVKSNENNSTGGDVRFQDPIKTREVAHREVEEILNNGDFLRLENYLKLNKLGLQDSRSLGALLLLFPIEVQKQLFSLSSGSHWMEAFNNPGDVNFKCLELLEDISRVNPNEFKKDWEYLLICLWRMGKEEAIPFLRDMGPDEALAILNDMPKNVSIPLARETFPGNWAAILDPKFKPKEITDKRCTELYRTATQFKPLMDFNLLNTYRRESDLLQFLDVADINVEKEVYNASPEDSIIKQMRPPFYKIFEAEKSELVNLVKEYTVDHWSLALFNVARDMRASVEACFTDKEKFFYLEKLKQLDSNPPEQRIVSQLRKDIAQRFVDLKTITALNDIAPEGDSTNDETVEENVA